MVRNNLESSLKITASAPTKLIISGEHSVVCGYTALALAINFRVNATVKTTLGDSIKLILKPSLYHQKELTWSIKNLTSIDYFLKRPSTLNFDEEYLKQIISIKSEDSGDRSFLAEKCKIIFLGLLFAFGLQNLPIECTINSNIPIYGGMGSSASYSAALSAAFNSFVFASDVKSFSGRKVLSETDLDQINKYAFACERINHGTPSGLDNTTVVYGGLVLFREKRIATNLKKEQTKLYFEKNWVLLVIDSGVMRDTKTFIKRVSDIKQNYNSVVKSVFEAIDNLAKLIFESIEGEIKRGGEASKLHFGYIKNLLVMNHCLLKTLGVSIEQLDRICEICEKHGFGAKLTGAGGGGTVLCMIPGLTSSEKVTALRTFLGKEGFESHIAEIAEEGMQVGFNSVEV